MLMLEYNSSNDEPKRAKFGLDFGSVFGSSNETSQPNSNQRDEMRRAESSFKIGETSRDELFGELKFGEMS